MPDSQKPDSQKPDSRAGTRRRSPRGRHAGEAQGSSNFNSGFGVAMDYILFEHDTNYLAAAGVPGRPLRGLGMLSSCRWLQRPA